MMDQKDAELKIGLNATCLIYRPSGTKQRFVGIYDLIKRLMDYEFVVYELEYFRVCASWFGSTNHVIVLQTPLSSERRVCKFLCTR